MLFVPKQFQLVVGVLSAFYFGWKAGQVDKERDIAGEDPCLINVDGVLKPMPRTVCKLIETSKGLLG